MGKGSGGGLTRGDLRRNERLARLRKLVITAVVLAICPRGGICRAPGALKNPPRSGTAMKPRSARTRALQGL